MKRRTIAAAAAFLAGGFLAATSGAFAQTDAGTFSMAADSNLNITCPNALANTNVATDSETAKCAPKRTTTTTTAPTTTTTVPPPSGGCQFATPTTANFCDTFDQPTVNGPANQRAGQLNGVVWGTTFTEGNAPGTAIPTAPSACGTGTRDYPNNIEVCNGQLVDTVYDGGGDAQTSLAMYPRQPFDFTGRTGEIVFDVSNNTQGTHAAWPEFWMSDQPVPDPYNGIFANPVDSNPRNGFGIKFSSCFNNVCPVPGSVGIDTVVAVRDYQVTNLAYVGDQTVLESGPGQINHYQVNVSQGQIDIFGTDAFTPGQMVPTLKHIATIPSAGLSFTRGLIWLEDAHYGGCKFNTQCTNSFRWDNVGFDGPILPRDLGFDVPNNHVPDPNSNNPGTPGFDNAWNVNTTPVSLTIPAVQGIGNAAAALLVFNFYCQTPIPLDVAINRHDLSEPWPFPDSTAFATRTIAIPVPLGDLVAGDNNVTFTPPGGWFQVFNIDLILAAAGGVVPPG